MECAKVIPLFKQGERSDFNNCSSIFIIPVVTKVFERMIHLIHDQYLFYASQLTNQCFISSFHRYCMHYLRQLILDPSILIRAT